MRKPEAIEVMKACDPLYQNLRFIINYELKEEELETLRKFKQVYDDGLILDNEFLSEAGVQVNQLGLLVGYMDKLIH
jgi:hypothetical protein